MGTDGTVGVKKVFAPPMLEWGSRAQEVVEAIRQKGLDIVKLKQGDRILGFGPETGIEVLYPLDGPFPSSRRATNDTSVLLRVSAYGKTVLLTGDVEEIAYVACEYSGMDVSADVALIPHHGGKMDFARQLAMMIRPRFAVASSRYENPSSMKIYERLGARVFSTRKSGAVTFVIDSSGIEVREHRNR